MGNSGVISRTATPASSVDWPEELAFLSAATRASRIQIARGQGWGERHVFISSVAGGVRRGYFCVNETFARVSIESDGARTGTRWTLPSTPCFEAEGCLALTKP